MMSDPVMNDVTLILGDALVEVPRLAQMDVIICDPPYGDGTYETDKAFPWEQLLPLPVKTLAIFGYPERMVAFCVKQHMIPDEWVTWWPTNKPAAKSARMPKSCEVIAVFGETPGAWQLTRPRAQNRFCVKINVTRNAKSNSADVARLEDVWRDPAPGMMFNSHLRQHPNEKPVSLLEKLVILCSNPGDVVVDLTMGSGTTGVACVRTGRRFIGIEISEDYFKVAQKRIAEAQAQPPLFPPSNHGLHLTAAPVGLWDNVDDSGAAAGEPEH